MIPVLVLRMDNDLSESESACTYFILKELYIQKCGNWKKRCCWVHLLPHFYEESYGYDTKDVGKAQMVKSFTLGVQNTVVHYHMGWRKNKRLTNLWNTWISTLHTCITFSYVVIKFRGNDAFINIQQCEVQHFVVHNCWLLCLRKLLRSKEKRKTQVLKVSKTKVVSGLESTIKDPHSEKCNVEQASFPKSSLCNHFVITNLTSLHCKKA